MSNNPTPLVYQPVLLVYSMTRWWCSPSDLRVHRI